MEVRGSGFNHPKVESKKGGLARSPGPGRLTEPNRAYGKRFSS